MKLALHRQCEDGNWEEVPEGARMVRVEHGTGSWPDKTIIDVTEGEDGVIKVQVISGRVSVNSMCRPMEFEVLPPGHKR